VYATIKHYTGYQVETNRFGFDANVSERDLVMTYLLPFQVAAAEGGNVGAMCAYPSLNGVPMCGSPVLERGVLRRLATQSPALLPRERCGLGRVLRVELALGVQVVLEVCRGGRRWVGRETRVRESRQERRGRQRSRKIARRGALGALGARTAGGAPSTARYSLRIRFSV
jgi:hypothetical protein